MSVRAFRTPHLAPLFVPSGYRRPDPRDPGLARNVAKSPAFLAACKIAEVEPTVRQARKWRRGDGRARVAARVA